MLTHLSLFSGIGGIDIAAEWAGFVTAGQCEFADYPVKILEKHWPNVPKWRDIQTLTGGDFYDRTGLCTVNIISGGFPCQPFSVAGKRAGKEDERYLWPEMLRVIRELKPRWVVGENVPGILRIAGDTVCTDLEREGYSVGIFDYEAAAVGAPHRRERIFFVANTESFGLQRKRRVWEQISDARREEDEFERLRNDLLNTTGEGLQYREFSAATETCGQRGNIGGRTPKHVTGEWRTVKSGVGGVAYGVSSQLDKVMIFPPEPDIPRVATGVKNRVDRLKCLGNAVVPMQIYPIFKAIAEIELSK